MKKEIERKFLVNSEMMKELKQEAFKVEKLQQGYLQDDPVVRIRIDNQRNKAWLTIKNQGLEIRSEYEYSIPYSDGLDLLEFCKWKLNKTRYTVSHGEHLWEIDEFSDKLQGLILAEVELIHPEDLFMVPEWTTQEVTYDKKYSNIHLAKLENYVVD